MEFDLDKQIKEVKNQRLDLKLSFMNQEISFEKYEAQDTKLRFKLLELNERLKNIDE